MADIDVELQAIEKAVYGEEVRDSIHDAIDKMNHDLETAIGHQLLTVDSTLTQTGQGADAKVTGELISETYNSSNKFLAGDHVVKDGVLNECIQSITSPEAWSNSKWQPLNVGNLVRTAKRLGTQYSETGYNTLAKGTFDRGVFNPANNTYSLGYTYRIAARTPIQFSYPVKLIIADGFRILPYLYNSTNGTYSQGSWITAGYYNMDANRPYFFQIARVTEDTSELADIDYFLQQVTYTPVWNKSYVIHIAGDGTTDDGAIISSEIARGVREGYSRFEFDPKKTAYISTPMVLSNNIEIEGNGISLRSVNLSTGTGITPTRIISSTSASSIVFRDITFVGSSSSSITSGSGTPDNLIYLQSCTNIRFESCRIAYYDSDINTSLSGYDEYSRAERWSAAVCLSCTDIHFIDCSLDHVKREGITLSKCTDFSIVGLQSYDNYTVHSYTPLNLFDCNIGIIDRIYMVHASATSAINFFTSNTILENSVIIATNDSSSGLDLGNEIHADHYYTNDIIANNYIKSTIRRMGVEYGHQNLKIIGNIIDGSETNAYIMAMPCGDVTLENNTIIAKPARYCCHFANGNGTYVLRGNRFSGRNAINLAPRENEVTNVILEDNYATCPLIEIQNVSYVNSSTRIVIKSINNVTESNAIKTVSSTTTSLTDTFKIDVQGGRSKVSSAIDMPMTLELNGHTYEGSDRLLTVSVSNLINMLYCYAKAGLIHATGSSTITGNMHFCTAYALTSVDSGSTDSMTKSNNVLLL